MKYVCERTNAPCFESEAEDSENGTPLKDMQDGGFVIVKSRRKKNSKSTFNTNPKRTVHKQGETAVEINEDLVIKKVLDTKASFSGTQFLKDTKVTLQTALRSLPEQTISEIICYGLGHFTECVIARHQLALLLYIRELFNASVFVHDPIFFDAEVRLLQELGLNIILENEEGKRKLNKGVNTLLYFPHCSKQLTNNFLWCNWGPELESCVLFGNSFSGILSSELSSNSQKHTCFIQKIHPYTTEFELENNFKHQDIFNNTSIHTFPADKLSIVEQGFWEDCEEPDYGTEDTEFITNL